MQYTQARPGRIFVLRLTQGEIIHRVIEDFARKQGIKAAVLTALGGVEHGSRLVTGPGDGLERPVQPTFHTLEGVHEAVGSGTIFPDEEGNPVVHMHMACGRGQNTVTGCIRPGVVVWQILEVVLQELTHFRGVRSKDNELGVSVLSCS